MARSKGLNPEIIKARIHMKGGSLSGLARKNGMKPVTLRRAIRRNDCPAAEMVIANYLNISPFKLWPDRYDAEGVRIIGRGRKSRRNTASRHCQKRRAA